eukprot:TRINITY_DN60284_c0_g1_i1.p1 TRINITY_DN60284_c0_g1~~TRINITY_DN60284_c0_g1_i1.p1  ORF type:complete len:633 (+),score=177.02 TRINITY_DN60284_c0_g1_i1:114-2012(+)
MTTSNGSPVEDGDAAQAACQTEPAAPRGRRKSRGIPATIDVEAFGEVLAYLPAADLVHAEQVSRAVRSVVLYRQLWRQLFVYRCQRPTDGEAWHMPPADCAPKCWKQFYHQYSRELARPACLRRRSAISATYVWRVAHLRSKLCSPLQIHHSEAFSTVHEEEPLTRTGSEESLGRRRTVSTEWRLLLQELHRDGKEQIGVFLQQDASQSWWDDALGRASGPAGPAHCYFSLAMLDHAYRRIDQMYHACEKRFEHGSGAHNGNTCGWLFPVDRLEGAGVLRESDELIVELDITVFPSELCSVKPLYELVASELTEPDLKRVVVQSLGDFVTHHAQNPLRAKRALQTLDGGPVPLVDIFEAPGTNVSLKSAVAGCLWNILDTSSMYIEQPLLIRIIDSACSTLMEVMLDSGCCLSSVGSDGAAERPARWASPLRRSGSVWGRPPRRRARAGDDADLQPLPRYRTVFSFSPRLHHSEIPLPGEDGEPSEETRSLVNSLCGLMWNIPITEHHRDLLASHWAFFPGLAAVLSRRSFRRSHFSCLHLLTTQKLHGKFPKDPEASASFSRFLEQYLGDCDHRDQAGNGVCNQDAGVALSIRDVADFFLPLLRAKDLDCVAFGKWAMTVFYWNTTDIYGA